MISIGVNCKLIHDEDCFHNQHRIQNVQPEGASSVLHFFIELKNSSIPMSSSSRVRFRPQFPSSLGIHLSSSVVVFILLFSSLSFTLAQRLRFSCCLSLKSDLMRMNITSTIASLR